MPGRDPEAAGCECARCECHEHAEINIGGARLCGCCAADCPDVHEGAWERREALYASAVALSRGDGTRTPGLDGDGQAFIDALETGSS